MRKVEIELYKFEELPTDIQAEVLAKQWSINVEWDWWDTTYEVINDNGMTCKGFNLDRGQSISLYLNNSCYEIATDFLQFGECDEKTAAIEFIDKMDEITGLIGDNEEGLEEYEEKAMVLEGEFQHQLENFCFKWLQDEYTYRMSDEAIKETILANEYEFTKDGVIY